MKRNLIPAALCLLCALLLAGCGGSAPAPVSTPAGSLPVAESPALAEAAPDETAVPEPESEASPAPVATLPDAGMVHDDGKDSAAEALFKLAKSFAEKPLSELQAEIGQPRSSSYVSSCLIPGGQDGELHYDGFTVYTVKDGDTETVLDVLKD